MIVFDLACDCGFTFEGWFRDRNDFEDQLKACSIACPECGAMTIRKILSPVSHRSHRHDKASGQSRSSAPPVSRDEAEKALATLQRYVEENFDNVGSDLAAEALKIHYGVSEPRNIRGVTTEPEEQELEKEGIHLLKIPMPVKPENVN